MALEARYPGWCYASEHPIDVGDSIQMSAELGQFVHTSCHVPVRRPEVTCTTCFMVKPCECDDA